VGGRVGASRFLEDTLLETRQDVEPGCGIDARGRVEGTFEATAAAMSATSQTRALVERERDRREIADVRAARVAFRPVRFCCVGGWWFA
jgi:hypothetical protein